MAFDLILTWIFLPYLTFASRLVAILAELGQKGGALRFVGKIALLWGGIRGAMSLTDRLISFLRISERPLFQRWVVLISTIKIILVEKKGHNSDDVFIKRIRLSRVWEFKEDWNWHCFCLQAACYIGKSGVMCFISLISKCTVRHINFHMFFMQTQI